jgi:hypothetical protein
MMPRPPAPIARLGWLLDGEFDVAAAGPNRSAADLVVSSLGTRADTDAALLVGFVMLAEAVDADPTNAALWGQYRAAEAAIREAAGSDDDDFARIMAELSADVRDPEVAEP